MEPGRCEGRKVRRSRRAAGRRIGHVESRGNDREIPTPRQAAPPGGRSPRATVRAIVHQEDGRIPVMEVRTQAAEIDHAMNQEIVFARLCTGFAILALVIASVGLYGTT